jgi:hypothetical protein
VSSFFPSQTGFDAVPLDDRLRKAIAHAGWLKPTDVQVRDASRYLAQMPCKTLV